MARKPNRVVAAVAAAAVVGGAAGAAAVSLTTHSTNHSSGTAASAATVSTVASGAALSVGQIAKQSIPGVVEIDATESSSNSPFPGSSSNATAEGTGFVFDANGDIVTNEHVIDGSSAVKVKFSDGSTYNATIVGSDVSTDVAVLHTNAPASKLHVLPVADSSTVQIGDGVVAIGNPFGLDDSVSSGIVSQLNREIQAPNEVPIEGAIQTDAAINHGNSGGPLFDMQGKVIGVTAQIQSDSGANDGVGFAIPSNLVKSIATQLIAHGSVKHALLGVTLTTNAAAGVKVSTVETNSGASKAGVHTGDVIVAINGASMTSSQQVRAIIDQHQPGDVLELTIQRNGAKKTIKVTLGTRTS